RLVTSLNPSSRRETNSSLPPARRRRSEGCGTTSSTSNQSKEKLPLKQEQGNFRIFIFLFYQ
ncbi:MAG: hypothetical protein ACK5F0_08950, partial [Flavobacteriales bacterium]